MGPEDSAKGLHHGPQLCRWAAGDGPARERSGPRSLGSPALGLDTCRAWDHVDGQILGQLRPLAEEEEEEGAGATSPRGPAFPGMGSEELRLASFYDWPLTAGVPPELLAAAGFFHTGQQDKVRCFFCYGGLQSWKRGDDPWTEHAKWFPSCQFLLRSKGRDFVHSVQETHSQLLGSWVSATSPRGSGRQWGPAPPISPRHRRSLAPSRTRGKNRKMQPLWPPLSLPLGTLSCPRPEERSSLKAPRSQEPGTWRSSCGGCRRRGRARCAWTVPCPSSLCHAATWSVLSVPPACSCAPSAEPPSAAVCAPSCPRPGTVVGQVGCRVGSLPLSACPGLCSGPAEDGRAGVHPAPTNPDSLTTVQGGEGSPCLAWRMPLLHLFGCF
ncbi:PREDICTED: baculoviral IAP repeat-containing protein 7 isoform X2 [Cercocebus atys]|uniref:baculoviral IAP repeat-containing protein 7 isoform X2 n=1 Tax=Cercocebus atys TaxID=9531 RepID=UPI0005F4CF4B|nr:PREDICTED: baculoviral IAP repeat-containing protein 7 isoform X2 [Cercocebus atys]